jgi:hypothetical protein
MVLKRYLLYRENILEPSSSSTEEGDDNEPLCKRTRLASMRESFKEDDEIHEDDEGPDGCSMNLRSSGAPVEFDENQPHAKKKSNSITQEEEVQFTAVWCPLHGHRISNDIILREHNADRPACYCFDPSDAASLKSVITNFSFDSDISADTIRHWVIIDFYCTLHRTMQQLSHQCPFVFFLVLIIIS